ncbi:MAG: hypothetical protein U0892_21040 [Pirellulales bacterium]
MKSFLRKDVSSRKDVELKTEAVTAKLADVLRKPQIRVWNLFSLMTQLWLMRCESSPSNRG